MRRGRHAASDGSLHRSTGIAIGRGVALLVVAVVIAVVVLDRSNAPAAPAAASSTTTTTVAPSTSTTSGSSHSSTTSTTRSRRGRAGRTPTSTTTTVPPAQVKALVANGTQVTGLAARVGAQLQNDGYDVLSPVNAVQQVGSSTVYYAPGSKAAATGVASAVGLGSGAVKPLPSASPVSSLDGAQVVVVAGPDLANRFPASSSPPTSASTA